MKVLVVGGTRLLGRSVVRHLLASAHLVTVLSRRTDACPAEARCLGMDRRAGLALLSRESFDVVIDFLAYDGAAVAEALSAIPDASYILISSTWITRLHPHASIDQPVTAIDHHHSTSLLAATRDYLLGKHTAEAVVFASRDRGGRATALRLPIFLGDGDHTGRIEFYRQRSNDGGAVISVDGGRNLAQVAWTEDLARAIVKWLPFASRHPIWDGCPDAGVPVRELVQLIGGGPDHIPRIVDVPSATLAEHLPAYLEQEPFWREVSVSPSERNIFSTTGIVTTPHSQWLRGLRGVPDPSFAALRAKELTFINDFAT